MRNAFFLLLLIASWRVDAARLELAYGIPFFSPFDYTDSLIPVNQEKHHFTGANLFEFGPVVSVGPRVSWTFWTISPKQGGDPEVTLGKLEYAATVKVRKQTAQGLWIFLAASGGAQWLRYSYESRLQSAHKSEWGAGRSIGFGADIWKLTLSLHQDAVVGESLDRELTGLRLQMGLYL